MAKWILRGQWSEGKEVLFEQITMSVKALDCPEKSKFRVGALELREEEIAGGSGVWILFWVGQKSCFQDA